MDKKGPFERFCDRYFRDAWLAVAVAAPFILAGFVFGWMFADSLGASSAQHVTLAFQGATIFMFVPIFFNVIAGGWWSRR